MVLYKDGLKATRKKRKGRFYIEIRDVRTGRFVKGTNKTWSKNFTLTDAINFSLGKRREVKRVIKPTVKEVKKAPQGEIRVVVNVNYLPKSKARKFNMIIGEVQIDAVYNLGNNPFDEVKAVLQDRFRNNPELLEVCGNIFEEWTEVNIPFNDLRVNVERHNLVSDMRERTDVRVFVRGYDRSREFNLDGVVEVTEKIINEIL